MQITGSLLRDISTERVTVADCGDTQDNINEMREDTECDDYSMEYSELEEDALEYIAGYVIKKLKLPVPPPDKSLFTWVDQLSEGGLINPGYEFASKIVLLENVFKKCHGENVNVNIKAVESCINESTNVDVPLEAKKLFFRTRIYIRIKNLNKRNFIDKRAKRRKMNKTVN